MIKIIKVFVFCIVFILFSGCSSKSIYEPNKIVGVVDYDGKLPAKIVDVTRSGATLENGQVIVKKYGLLKTKIPKGYRFLSFGNKKIISTSPTGKLEIETLKDKNIFSYNFKNIIASAKLNKNILALVFADNSIELFDIKQKKILFNKKLDDICAVDARIANPYFLGTLVVFPTLDGRLVIVDTNTYKEIKDIVVSSKKYFNNVIFLNVLDNRLVAATQNRIISIDPKNVYFMNVGVKDIIFLGERIFIFTKDGRIILSSSTLQNLKERKFKFANFSTAIYGNFIYAIEKSGYLIAVDKNLITANVYQLPNAINDLMFTTGKTLYYNDEYFKLNVE